MNIVEDSKLNNHINKLLIRNNIRFIDDIESFDTIHKNRVNSICSNPKSLGILALYNRSGNKIIWYSKNHLLPIEKYTIIMHEIGHALSGKGTKILYPTIIREASAWEWAIENCLSIDKESVLKGYSSYLEKYYLKELRDSNCDYLYFKEIQSINKFLGLNESDYYIEQDKYISKYETFSTALSKDFRINW